MAEEAEPMGSVARILVVEDDENILNLLSAYLEGVGHEVCVCADGEQGLASALTDRFDICILDVMLPGKTGVDIAEAMRTNGVETPIIFLTAKGAEADVLAGFAVGADDYMIKPFSPRELIVRIESVLRRAGTSRTVDSSLLEIGPLSLDTEQPTCTLHGRSVVLTPYEHKILKRLLEQPNRILARGQLISLLYGNDHAVSPKAIDVHVHNLRTKLGHETGQMIETVRGFGYRFTPLNPPHSAVS